MKIKARMTDLGWKPLETKDKYISSEGFYVHIGYAKEKDNLLLIKASLDEYFLESSEFFTLPVDDNLVIFGDDKSLVITNGTKEAIHIGALQRYNENDKYAWVIGNPKEGSYIAKGYHTGKPWVKLHDKPKRLIGKDPYPVCTTLYYFEDSKDKGNIFYRGNVRFCKYSMSSKTNRYYTCFDDPDEYIGTNSGLAINRKYLL